MRKDQVLRAKNGTLSSPIDRRLAGKNKSIGNRERFVRRYKEQIREAVGRAVAGRNIKDVASSGEEIRIPKKDIREPTFRHGSGGTREMVHPGNKKYVEGDLIKRPEKGDAGGSGKGQASDSGIGEDDFTFALSKEEFMQVFFDDLALPNLTRTTLAETPEYKWRRAGIVTDGTPTNLSLIRSKRQQIGRRLAGTGKRKREIEELEKELERLRSGEVDPRPLYVSTRIAWIEQRILRLERAIALFSRLDPLDLRYRNRVKVPVPTTKAVMFCLMDVSGSMDEKRKDLAKRFFILLYLFLTRHYEKIEIVFIRHHTQAAEVPEEEFFNSRETGGTVVSSALILMEEIIRARYSPSEWNIYGAQASDGDNWHQDSGKCTEILRTKLLPLCRYFAYIQVAEEKQNLWEEYDRLAASEDWKGKFAIKKASEATQIYPVFHELFQRKEATS